MEVRMIGSEVIEGELIIFWIMIGIRIGKLNLGGPILDLAFTCICINLLSSI